MKIKQFLSIASIVGLAVPGFALADHLLLSEVATDTVTESAPASSEYVEIFNPTGATVSLDNYYISDANNATNPALRYYSVAVTGPADLGASDYLVRFPTGTSIAPGKVVVVTQDAATFLNEYFGGSLAAFTGQAGSPQLFEVTPSDAVVADMINFNTNATTPGTFSKTNGGEFVVLFNWDQTSDLVKDVDVIQWGAPTGGNAFPLKTSADTVDGPDADTNASAFNADSGPLSNISIASPYAAITRISSTETGETPTGGNGITGNDETTENASSTWQGGLQGTNSAGITSLPATGVNATPQIVEVFRSIEYPSSTSAITIQAGTADADGNVTQAKIYVDTGGGFAATNMTQVASTTTFTATIGPFPDDTTVKFYIEATDNGGATTLEPLNAPAGFRRFLVDNTPVTENDLVINEILYDDPSTDDYEFVELFNRRATAIDISGFGFGDNLVNIGYRFPEGTSIAGNGYLVLTLDIAALEAVYGPIANKLDWGGFVLNNGGDNVHWIHVNAIDFNGTNDRTDLVSYTNADPWPVGAAGTGQTIELKNPSLDNNVAGNWAISTTPSANGTPGAVNSVNVSAVADWQLY